MEPMIKSGVVLRYPKGHKEGWDGGKQAAHEATEEIFQRTVSSFFIDPNPIIIIIRPSCSPSQITQRIVINWRYRVLK